MPTVRFCIIDTESKSKIITHPTLNMHGFFGYQIFFGFEYLFDIYNLIQTSKYYNLQFTII
jgi:hypothetical protein